MLRIEDTDLERSTPEAVAAIHAGMQWLGLGHDEGPFYQTQRMDRYREVIAQMLAAGQAYRCYCTREELEAMRERQRSAGEKPRYDGSWRPEPGKVLPQPPAEAPFVIRFRNPTEGSVEWNDLVKGPISISNQELDDLIIARTDGSPTYNFCVVVDDWDMKITHVIRGDDHVNNTPRQINILRALGATLPNYGHVPMILGADGEKLSKRHGAVSVTQYDEDGYLPEAMLNFLARLGWSHGNDEVFDMEQFVSWFDLEHISRSAAQFNPEKLLWINQQYLKTADNARLAGEVRRRMERQGVHTGDGPALDSVVALYKERVATLNELADAIKPFYHHPQPAPELVSTHINDKSVLALAGLCGRLQLCEWSPAAINQSLKDTVAEHGLKFPQLAIPLRVVLTGQTQTPSIDAVVAVMDREEVLRRISIYL